MDDERKKRGWRFWATVGLVVLLLAYPLSFGPWCWLAVAQPDLGHVGTMSSFYKPIIRVWFDFGGTAVGSVIGWYANIGSRHELNPGKDDDGIFAVVASP